MDPQTLGLLESGAWAEAELRMPPGSRESGIWVLEPEGHLAAGGGMSAAPGRGGGKVRQNVSWEAHVARPGGRCGPGDQKTWGRGGPRVPLGLRLGFTAYTP